jgi:hypothetical protein
LEEVNSKSNNLLEKSEFAFHAFHLYHAEAAGGQRSRGAELICLYWLRLFFTAIRKADLCDSASPMFVKLNFATARIYNYTNTFDFLK